ncbi:putative sodium calcium transporter [Diaporthe ampelina]|uniref:Putative sodium calcium transporter n=1 Tax=Diaporthe ampelina TaxID=1214573 RepID=A0A0G2F9G5_9PEZI|nr:putative sodium calcium transporter [Diaporthe ampelina]
MADLDTLFSIAAFFAGLSLLERGSKLFVESTTTLAKRLRLPEVLVAILIAGAEWEELAVVSLSIAQERPALAVGNVIGSSVANILGAFALGLVFSSGSWSSFDRTSKLATRGLLGFTTFFWLFSLAHIMWNRIVASLLLVSFAGYLFVVLWTIWQAMFYTEDNERDDVESGAAAHDDAASSSSSSSSSSDESGHRNHFLDRHRHFVSRHFLHRQAEEPTETTTLLGMHAPEGYDPKKFHHTLGPALQVLAGFAALTVSGFILSRTSIHLASALNMSDSAFGATFLSLATTLPEKFLAVMSSSKGHTGLMVADAVGSNMFLLTLCLGITAWSIASHDWHDHESEEDGGFAYVDIARIEAWWLWTATIALTLIVNFGGKLFCKFVAARHVVGILMLMGYGGFLAIEFTILREE